jgi:hypothetical protein
MIFSVASGSVSRIHATIDIYAYFDGCHRSTTYSTLAMIRKIHHCGTILWSVQLNISTGKWRPLSNLSSKASGLDLRKRVQPEPFVRDVCDNDFRRVPALLSTTSYGYDGEYAR